MPDVWIDTRGTALDGGTGIATYATGLASTLERMGITPDFLRLTPAGAPVAPGRPGALTVASCILRALAPWVGIRQDCEGHPYLPYMFRMGNTHLRCFGRPLCLKATTPPAIMHWTYPLPLKVKNAVNITTIHDIIPLLNPDLTGINPVRMKRVLRAVTRNMDHIITVTETVRQQVITHLGVDESRITNLYQCAGISVEEARLLPEAERIAPADAFVCVGRVEARKNIRRLVIAHGMSKTRRPLVIIGPDGDDRPDLSPVQAGQTIIRVPWCARPSLLRAMAEARALLFPSLAEGFGLPIIEAMSLDIPVMTSMGGATEEVSGGAALLVDPLDSDQMRKTICVLDGMDAEKRENLCKNGRERANFFSIDSQAARMKVFYKNHAIG
ncbi:Protein rfbU [Gluconacetobacter sp. SXCC-1]|uniref:Glycosyltransferase family 4 protein n=2 Tax=Komagataeibacter rhaeticus TaxID=215221 RepID=A0A181C6C9_9PROT|nr:glycosyltransferase family 1 protein [Komagataeibacter rhaeticus]ATU73972.1 glycosyltransferase family 1 protein [Komagataeibacter xylinus]EGG77819.1 Protein rfbU [Gluconacetobacter sp. SXCC-1]QIP34136.1 glycosyltransferase family 4 protein [Komagataeibacter rhaeticus]QOC46645.1 glycosyltransferase family 4 protein [Komagataeibacter rhaeticus]WPP20987.1 glycosyltransferase family 1 protein [Komagataeibacter rhaeticus]